MNLQAGTLNLLVTSENRVIGLYFQRNFLRFWQSDDMTCYQVFLCMPFVLPPLSILSLSLLHALKPTVLYVSKYNSKLPVSISSLIIFQPADSSDDYISKIVSDKQ